MVGAPGFCRCDQKGTDEDERKREGEREASEEGVVALQGHKMTTRRDPTGGARRKRKRQTEVHQRNREMGPEDEEEDITKMCCRQNEGRQRPQRT